VRLDLFFGRLGLRIISREGNSTLREALSETHKGLASRPWTDFRRLRRVCGEEDVGEREE